MTKVIAEESDELFVEDFVDDEESPATYDIASYPSDLTLSVVNEMWKNADIIVPEYQRNFVWTIKQASLLIESFLLGLPVPQVFFYIDENNKSQVIDGQQRIMSVVFFLDGHFGFENLQGKKQVFRLQGLNSLSPFAKKTFRDLDESHQRKLRSAVLRAINIRQLNPRGEATSVYHIFERLNTGGTPLKPQEIRNCVFRGEFIGILRKLNENAAWRSILGKKTLDRHQKDVELLLRVFALSSFLDEYEKPMKEFLNTIMERERKGNSPAVTRFASSFPRAAELVIQHLGERPFHVRGPMNSSVLDAVLCTIIGAKGKVPKDLYNRYSRMLEDEDYRESTFLSTSDKAVLLRRFSATKTYLVE